MADLASVIDLAAARRRRNTLTQECLFWGASPDDLLSCGGRPSELADLKDRLVLEAMGADAA